MSDTKQVWFTGDLIEPDDTDTNVYGEPTEAGHGEVLTTGWVDLDWSMWTVYEEREGVRPDTYEPDEFDERTPVQWLADTLENRLNGFPEYHGGTTVYGDAYSHPYDGKSISVAAHPEGFTNDEIAEACRLAKEKYQ